jgi:DtxR family Mn-dependent transcriptional regulator
MSRNESREPTEYRETNDSEHRISSSEGRYLCGLLFLSLDEDRPIESGELADYLDVSVASVTEMIAAFDERGLVVHEPYVGAELTDLGERVAREIMWRRCTVQRYFETSVGVELNAEQAYRIGRELEDEDVRKLGERVDNPCRDGCTATSRDDCGLLAT